LTTLTTSKVINFNTLTLILGNEKVFVNYIMEISELTNFVTEKLFNAKKAIKKPRRHPLV